MRRLKRNSKIAYLRAALHFIGAILAAIPSCVSAQTISVPNALNTVEGDSGTGYFAAAAAPQTFRFQQVYAASQFSQIAAGGWIYYGMSFRVDSDVWNTSIQGDASSFGVTFTNIEMRFSTTSREPDALSPVFSDNIGPDETIVYSSSLPLGGSFYRWLRPQPWNITIPLSSSFHYKPTNGNLLLDVRVNAGYGLSSLGQSIFPQFDAANDGADSVSSVYADSVEATSGTTTTLGLITQFQATGPPSLWFVTSYFGTNYLAVRWPTEPGGFVLQQSSLLGPAASWEPLQPTYSNLAFQEYKIPAALTRSNAFYRLVYQGP